MASSAGVPLAVKPDTLIRIKVTTGIGKTFKTKLPLSDLTPATLPSKLRALIQVQDSQACTFERFSDSSNSYVNLDTDNLQAYKTLYRAAKAKLRLNIRATVAQSELESLKDFNQSLLDFAKLNIGSSSALASTLRPTSITAPEFPSIFARPARAVSDVVETQMATPTAETEKPDEPKVEEKEAKQDAGVLLCGDGRLKYPTFTHYADKTMVRSCGHSASHPNVTGAWSVYCNHCDKNMLNDHYHCNICDEGDFDLCVDCKEQGVHCRSEDHWLIKRFLDGRGYVISSTTETVGPRSVEEKTMPGAFTDEKKVEEPEAPTRTCNSCIKSFTENAFVHCQECEDFDLCLPCLRRGKHGHHPGHAFEPVQDSMNLNKQLNDACKAGRNTVHQAICDQCDKSITGVRHKCLNCPDWDYCSDCIARAGVLHPGHRFVKVYDPISSTAMAYGPLHQNIHCDGPLCKFKNAHIRGIRFKCVVCDDVDFCANCEASPQNTHNKTHPLLKLRTPVRDCNVETIIDEHNVPRSLQTTVAAASAAVAAATAATITNAATQIRTVADVKPTETAKATKDKIEIKDLLSAPIPETVKTPNAELQADFVHEAVKDGTNFMTGSVFYQCWIVKNTGSVSWPAGCVARYVGGDNMLFVDDSRPSSELDMNRAIQSHAINREVKPGEEVSFRILLKAPKRAGTAISYWRIKTPEGVPFGARLWCHVNVIQTPEIKATSTVTGPDGKFMPLLTRTIDFKAAEARKEAMRKYNIIALHRQQVAAAAVAAANAAVAGPSTSEPPFVASEEPVKAESSAKGKEPVTRSAETSPLLATAPLDPIVLASPFAIITPEAEPAVEESKASDIESVTEVESKDDMFEDAETVTLSSDDGFVTDEEYDILDASDHEEATSAK